MANVISDETIEYVGILAKLELSDEEKEAAKKDMGRMLDYIDKLSELDTTGVEPMSHVFPVQNVFREDVVTNGDESEQTLANAPGEKDNMFVVPSQGAMAIDYDQLKKSSKINAASKIELSKLQTQEEKTVIQSIALFQQGRRCFR